MLRPELEAKARATHRAGQARQQDGAVEPAGLLRQPEGVDPGGFQRARLREQLATFEERGVEADGDSEHLAGKPNRNPGAA